MSYFFKGETAAGFSGQIEIKDGECLWSEIMKMIWQIDKQEGQSTSKITLTRLENAEPGLWIIPEPEIIDINCDDPIP